MQILACRSAAKTEPVVKRLVEGECCVASKCARTSSNSILLIPHTLIRNTSSTREGHRRDISYAACLHGRQAEQCLVVDIAESDNPGVEFMQLDLSSLQSVVLFAKTFRAKYDRRGCS